MRVTRQPDELFLVWSFFLLHKWGWQKGENATRIPATETATAPKSRGRCDANVAGALTSSPSHCEGAARRDSHARSRSAQLSLRSSIIPPHFGTSARRWALEEEKRKKRGKEGGNTARGKKRESRPRPGCSNPEVRAAMDETDIMDLTHQKARKRARPITSVDESMHASLKRLPMRAAECREPSLMFAVRGEPVPAASLKQNDHSVTSSPNTVMPAQVKKNKKKSVRYFGCCVENVRLGVCLTRTLLLQGL